MFTINDQLLQNFSLPTSVFTRISATWHVASNFFYQNKVVIGIEGNVSHLLFEQY